MENQKRALCASALIGALVVGGGAQGATFTYNLTVQTSRDAVVDDGTGPVVTFDLPDVGSTGTVVVDFDPGTSGGDPIPPEGVDISDLLSLVSARFGDLTTSLDPFEAQIDPRTSTMPPSGGVRLRNGSFSALDVDIVGSIATGTIAGGFSVFSEAFGPAPPVTFDDVFTILSAPDAVVSLSFNGTAETEFVDFLAVSTPMAPVPLPAGGLLLLTALGGFAVARRRA